MINKATGTPIKYGELWARSERYRERMISELQRLENETKSASLRMIYQYLREQLFIPCNERRLDATVSHDLNLHKNILISAIRLSFEEVSELANRTYEEEVEERTENLTEYV